ncbi:MAG: hypothetical protein JSS96_10665, partial [Bacteroidetes bacterium]|nr:hypothetical protein [Bacteroidota bacterium]
MKQKLTLLFVALSFFAFSNRSTAQNIMRQSFDTTNIEASSGAFGWTDSVDYFYCCSPYRHWYYGPPIGTLNTWNYYSGFMGYAYMYPNPNPHSGKGQATFNTAYMYGPYCCGIGAGHTELHTPSVALPSSGKSTVSYWLYITRPYSYSTPYYTSDSVSIWINNGPRYAGGTRLDKIGVDNVSSTLGWVQYTDTLPASYYGSNAYISFVGWPGYYGYYNADINMDDVTVDHYTSCSGHPTAGSITGPSHICQNKQFTLTDTSLTYLLGVSYQWQSRAAGSGAAWTSISGATGNSYSTTLGTAGSTDYRVYATCANSGQTDTSNSITVNADLFYRCYCAMPTTNTNLGGNPPPTIDSVSIVNTALQNRTAAALPAPNYWAQYPDTMNTTANLTKGGYYTAYVRYASGTSYGMAWIDYNRNGNFESSEYIPINTTLAFFGTATFIVPVSASLGKTGFRVRNGYVYYPYSGYACSNFGTSTGAGETEDYIVNIVPQPSHDLGAVALIAPANNATYCANRVDTVMAKVYNYGSSVESNFYVYATYTDSSGAVNSIYTKYTGNLASASSDNVYIGTINPPNGGKYKLKVFTVLATDSIHVNDSSSGILNLTTLPILPTVSSDTVCPGTSVAVVGVKNIPNISFKWYTSPTGTTSFKTDTTVSIAYPTKDSVIYVAAVDRNGCQSNRIPVTIAVRNKPAVDLGTDRTMCESPTFTLDAGNPGAKYLWSTGDTTQAIHVTSSGIYSVNVYRYCSSSDTVSLTINPLPKALGIDYVRSGNTYLFGVSGGQYINSYLWLFGDGDTSTQSNPL